MYISYIKLYCQSLTCVVVLDPVIIHQELCVGFYKKVAYGKGSRTSSVRMTPWPSYCAATHLCPLANSLHRLEIPVLSDVVYRTCRF